MGKLGSQRATPWLGRFDLPTVLRSQGAFHLASTRDQASGEPRVVVVGAPGRDTAMVRAALDRFARAHGRLDHPRIARVADVGEHEGARFVALACDAVADLALMLREARRVGLRLPHPQADGFIVGLRLALQAAHAAADDQGRPTCLGALGYGNVLFARDGRHWLVGFGHNVVTHDERGGLLGGDPVFQATELSVGGEPSPGGDFVALIAMMRSMIPTVGLAPGVARVLVGNSLPEDLELVRCLLWFERNVVAALPSQRASIEEAVRVSNRIRALLGVTPDPEGFEREAAAALGRLLPQGQGARGELRVGPDAAWIEAPDGSLHRLGSRGPLRRVLLSLTEARLRRPGDVLPVTSLIEAGWPGERAAAEAGANRTYVLLSALRRMGLRGVLQKLGEGYRLDPSLPVRLDPTTADQGEKR